MIDQAIDGRGLEQIGPVKYSSDDSIAPVVDLHLQIYFRRTGTYRGFPDVPLWRSSVSGGAEGKQGLKNWSPPSLEG